MKKQLSAAVALLAAACVLPSIAHAEEPEQVRTERMPELYISGPVLFGLAYGATIGVTAGITPRADVARATGYAAIPLAGPWVMLGSNLPTMPYAASLVASGIGQAAGLAMTIAGIVVKREVKPPSVGNGTVRVSFVPAGAGAVAIGSF